MEYEDLLLLNIYIYENKDEISKYKSLWLCDMNK